MYILIRSTILNPSDTYIEALTEKQAISKIRDYIEGALKNHDYKNEFNTIDLDSKSDEQLFDYFTKNSFYSRKTMGQLIVDDLFIHVKNGKLDMESRYCNYRLQHEVTEKIIFIEEPKD